MVIKSNKFNEVHDGFEGIEPSEIWELDKIKRSAIKMQSKIVRKGKEAMKITIHQNDQLQINREDKSTERDELTERNDLWSEEGIAYRYKFSLFIPKSFPIVKTRCVVAQWKQWDKTGNARVNNPIIALRYRSGEFYITIQTDEMKVVRFSTKEEIRGKWLDFKFDIKFTRNNSGFILGWMNGRKIISIRGVTAYAKQHGYPNQGIFYFKMGLYRDSMKKPMSLYLDEFYKKVI
ncbi:MAG: polysaccharide lyase [archaeon]